VDNAGSNCFLTFVGQHAVIPPHVSKMLVAPQFYIMSARHSGEMLPIIEIECPVCGCSQSIPSYYECNWQIIILIGCYFYETCIGSSRLLFRNCDRNPNWLRIVFRNFFERNLSIDNICNQGAIEIGRFSMPAPVSEFICPYIIQKTYCDLLLWKYHTVA